MRRNIAVLALVLSAACATCAHARQCRGHHRPALLRRNIPGGERVARRISMHSSTKSSPRGSPRGSPCLRREGRGSEGERGARSSRSCIRTASKSTTKSSPLPPSIGDRFPSGGGPCCVTIDRLKIDSWSNKVDTDRRGTSLTTESRQVRSPTSSARPRMRPCAWPSRRTSIRTSSRTAHRLRRHRGVVLLAIDPRIRAICSSPSRSRSSGSG